MLTLLSNHNLFFQQQFVDPFWIYFSIYITKRLVNIILFIISRWTTWIVWKIIPIQFTVERRAESFFLNKLLRYFLFPYVTLLRNVSLRYAFSVTNPWMCIRSDKFYNFNISYFRCLKMNVNNVRNIA
jgi:hypothetical protein